MVWTIARKQLLANILTYRIAVGFVLCVLLFPLSAAILTQDYAERLAGFNTAVSEHTARLLRSRVFSQLSLTIDRRPALLSPVCEGFDKRFAASAEVSYTEIPTASTGSSEKNPFMAALKSIDLAAIVQVVLGLLALLFAGEWGFSYNWSPGEPRLRSFEVARAWGRIVQGYQDSLLSQVELGRKCARFSPSALFTQTLESVTGSGIPDFERFLKSARQYRESLGTYLDQKFPLQKDIPLDRNTTDKIISGVKLDFASIPKFTDRQAPPGEAVGSALFGGGLLMLINLVLFVAAHISFLRYDVR